MKKIYLTALVLGSGIALSGVALAGPGCGHGGAHGPGARFNFEQLDVNKDAKVDLAELSQSKETWFAKVDGNKDGVVNEVELQAERSAQRAEHLDRKFAEQDANKDGRLTADETQMPARFFESADANKDGAVTREEMTASMAAAKAKHGGRAGGQLGHLDTNDDGQITRQEAVESAALTFARLDANKDGALTADEMALKRGHGRHHGKDKPAPTDSRS
jgi:Ca2+-binding EF-hand superfamily protein